MQSMKAHINSPSIWGAEARESWVSGHLQLHTKFKDSLVSTKEMRVEANNRQQALA